MLCAHEQNAAHAADGFARVTGKPGVVIATSGPGATNLVTGIANAYLDSVPLVAITGNVPTSLIGKDSFQEINITGVTMPITKHNYFVNDVKDLAPVIREAFAIAKSGRPGPVLIDVPKDVQIAECDYEPEAPVEKISIEEAPMSDIEKAIELVNESKRPYIYLGGGAAGLGLGDEILELAEKIDAYIGCTFMGLSAVPTKSERFLGMQGMHGHYASSVAQDEADLIIGVGVRFSDRATGNLARYAKNTKIIQLDPDFSEINKNVKVDVGVIGDVEKSFMAIAKAAVVRKNDAWRERVESLRADERRFEAAAEEANRGKLTPKKVLEIINKLKPANTVIATDVGQHQMWTAQYADFDAPRKMVSSGGLGTMGFGLGAAIGAKVATGDTVVLVTGDGSFGMNLNELATAVSHGIPVIVVLMNNGVLGMVRQWQTLFFGKRYSSTVLGSRKTDFVKLADAFGAIGMRAGSEAEFEKCFADALAAGETVVIDTLIDKDEFVLPMLPPGGSIDDIITEIKGDMLK